MNISDKTRWFEIIAVVVTGLFKFLFFDILNWHFVYVTFAVIFWLVYIYYRYGKNPGIIKYWGFTKNNLKITFRITAIFASVSLSIFILFAVIMKYPLWNHHIVYSILTYPFWGVIQQFLVMSLCAGNLKDMKSLHIKNIYIVFAVALLFSVVHFPSLLLVLGTFFLGIFYCIVFLKYRNLYPLGVFHGIIGAFFYFYVLNRDPWLQFIEMLK